ncbi:MAG: hypothetical protein FJ034_07695, partial [Chloroflexi bacterium]|nr:hypothetical protein [Chloroflexota bacterium]
MLIGVLFGLALLLGGGGAALAAPGATLVASYQATPPTTLAAGAVAPVSVTVVNAGDEVWPSSGATPVHLSYHWYDGAGNAVVWNGSRAALGQDVAPGQSRTVTIPVTAPAAAGAYTLRFALVKEGVAWFPPGPPHALTVPAAFQAAFGAVQLPTFVATGTYTVSVPVTNTGVNAWNAAGANPITLSYHWHDATGATVVWDGLRTALPADVPAGGQA